MDSVPSLRSDSSGNVGLTAVQEKCNRVRQALQTYEKLSMTRDLSKLDHATLELRQSFDALFVPDPPDSRVTLKEEPFTKAERVIAEINRLAGSDLSRESDVRLAALLQALTAEARLLLPSFPNEHPMNRCLVQGFRTIANIKEDRGITQFINGLGRGAQGNWQRIAVTCRQRVESFDRDTQLPSSRKPKLAKAPSLPREHGRSYPRLVQISKVAPIMLIGGVKIPEKLNYIRSHGVECEWYETDKTNPRATNSLVERIKCAKTPAVIFFESFMAHSTFNALKTACNLTRIPFATAERAGQGSIELAFTSLEMRV